MLDFFFKPQSVAIVGASQNPEKIGYFVLRNLISGKFPGKIYPINPSAKEILGHQVYSSLQELPEVPELVVFAVPREKIPSLLRQAGEMGVRGAIIITAGFREAGGVGTELEEELVAISHETGIKIIGPNCLGVVSPIHNLNASFVYEMPLQGSAAVISQSGAVGTAVLDIFTDMGVGFSYFVSIGNRCDVDESDLLEYFADDEATKVVCMYLEGVKDGDKFIRAARKVTSKKPLIILKAGISTKGSLATASHTGSLAGSNVAYRAAFRAVNAIQVLTLEDFSQLTALLSTELPPAEDGVVILTNAGGPGILAADAAERWNVNLADLNSKTKQRLCEILPIGCGVNNPVDVLGDAVAERYRAAAEVLSEDENVKTILLLLTAQAQTEPAETALVAREAFLNKGIPVVATFVGGNHVAEGRSELRRLGVPNVNFAEKAMKLMGAIRQRHVFTDREFKKPNGMELERIRELLAEYRNNDREWLLGGDALQVLHLVGIKTPVARMTTTVEEAITFAEKNGYPVSLKIVSGDIPHKSDFGGVRLKLQTPAEVTNAYKGILQTVKEKLPEAKIDGILVHEHVRGGREMIVGSTRDEQFGSMVMFGVGGVWVEANPDVTFRLSPVNAHEAFDMIKEIKSARVLGSFRGKEPADVGSLVDTIVRLSYLTYIIPEIKEIEINPILAMLEGEGAIAVDARIKI